MMITIYGEESLQSQLTLCFIDFVLWSDIMKLYEYKINHDNNEVYLLGHSNKIC